MYELTNKDRINPDYVEIREVMVDLARARHYPAGSRMAAKIPALTRRYEKLASRLSPEVVRHLQDRFGT